MFYINKKEIIGENGQVLNPVMFNQTQQIKQKRQEGASRHDVIAANAGLTPGDAYRYMDPTTKIIQVPDGEFATWSRLMQNPKAINLGHKLYQYRKFSETDTGQASFSGTIGVKGDKGDYTYGGAVVPIFDKGFGIDFRDQLALQAERFDALVDYSREAERGLKKTIDSYLWDGDASLVFKGVSWLGLRNDPTVANATLAVDLADNASTPEQISGEVSRVADILYVNNNVNAPMKLVVSRQIKTNWANRVYSTATGAWGTIWDYISNLFYFDEVYVDSNLDGNQIAMYWDDQQGFHAVSGMAMSTYALPREYHNAPFDYVKWCAQGFVSKTDADDRFTALYAS